MPCVIYHDMYIGALWLSCKSMYIYTNYHNRVSLNLFSSLLVEYKGIILFHGI